MKTQILYTGAFRFPDLDAAGTRVAGIAGVLSAAGMSVTIAGWEDASGPQGRKYTYNGMDCYPQSEFRTHDTSIVRRVLGFVLRGHRTARWLRKQGRFDAIIAYNPPALFGLLLILWCRVTGSALVLDSTEWYESSHLIGGRYGLAAVENWFRMRVVYKLFPNVICISSFLRHHFRKQRTLVVPPLLSDPVVIDDPEELSAEIRFAYAGSPGKKDKLTAFVRAMRDVQTKTSAKLVLEIAGVTWQELTAELARDGIDPVSVADLVRCHGRLSKSQVQEMYQRCHFSILFRDNKRYAWAGFPTKAVESWAAGKPIVMAPVGDVAFVAQHLKTAIVLGENELSKGLAPALNSIVNRRRYGDMSRASKATAVAMFSADAHRGRILTFFDALTVRA